MEVDLRAIEGTVAFVDLVRHVEPLEGGLQAAFCCCPIFVGAHGVVRTGGKFHMVFEAELLVHRVDEVHDADDFIGELVGAHEQVRVILGEATNAEQAVQRAAHFVTVHNAQFACANRQVAIAVRLRCVHEHAARAVHGLHAVLFFIDDGGVHVVFVVVPMARGLPQLLVHDERRGNLDVAGLAMDLAPVVDERVFQNHAVGKEEREAGSLVAHHEEVHFAADLAMVALLGLFEHAQMFVELFFGGKGDAVDAGEHLVVLVALPIGARNGRKREGLQGLRVANMGTDAHVDVVALLVEGNASVVGQVADVLDLVLLVALFHELDSLFARKLERRELQVLFHDLLHFGFNRGKVFLADFLVAQIDIVVEAVVGRGAIGEVGLGIEAFDGLRHDVRRGMAHDVRDFFLGQLGDGTVVVKGLHRAISSRMLIRIRY